MADPGVVKYCIDITHLFFDDGSVNIILLFEEKQNMPTPQSYVLNYLGKSMDRPSFFSTITIHPQTAGPLPDGDPLPDDPLPDGESLANVSATASANAEAYVPWALTVD